MKIKRILFYVISVLVCFLLQTSVFEFLKLADVMPNILLILTVTIAFIRGKKAGIVVGFVCGLLIDIFSGSVLGQYAFVYLMFGYINGWFHAYFYEDDILLPAIKDCVKNVNIEEGTITVHLLNGLRDINKK